MVRVCKQSAGTTTTGRGDGPHIRHGAKLQIRPTLSGQKEEKRGPDVRITRGRFI